MPKVNTRVPFFLESYPPKLYLQLVMNRDLPLIPTLIFIVSILIFIALYMQRVSSFSMPVVGQLFVQSGKAHALLGNQIIDLENGSEYKSLNALNIDNHVGQMGVIDDALFINTGGQSTSLLHKWRRFKRKNEYAVKKGGRSSLLKCSISLKCENWGDSDFQFNTAWGMFRVDDERFVIVDTARHSLHLAGRDGSRLDSLTEFKFPNHIFLYEGAYWVVNTNRNSFVELDIGATKLAKTGNQISLYSYQTIPDHYRFPSSAYSTKVENQEALVVLTHPNGMNMGQVYLLREGSAQRLLSDLKDITSILVHDQILYAADYASRSIWTLNLKNGDTERLENIGLQSAYKNAQTSAKSNWIRFLILGGLVLLVGVISLGYSLVKSRPI